MERYSDCWYSTVCKNECSQSCLRYTEMKHLMNSSDIPKNKQLPTSLNAPECDYSAFVELSKIKDDIKSFVQDGCSLYIASEYTGNGKTSWALKLMLKYFNDIWAGNGFRCRGKFVHVPTFLLKCKDFNNHDVQYTQYVNDILNCDLVIWDDIASTNISAYDYSQLLMYMDNRVLNDKSNIYTGNIVNRETLNKSLGSKLTSRIMSENTQIIIFKGGDKR